MVSAKNNGYFLNKLNDFYLENMSLQQDDT